MAKWLMYSKRADFTAMGKKYQIDPVVARILVNRDLTEDAAITAFFASQQKKTLGMEKPFKGYGCGGRSFAKGDKREKKDPYHWRL